MKIGVIIAEDAEGWGGEIGIGNYICHRLTSNDTSTNVEYLLFPAVSGSLPEDVSSFTGFVISGSHYSVNDNLPWIARLEKFISDLENIPKEVRPKLFGICFGHQVIAKALGGTVASNQHEKHIFGSEEVILNEEILEKEYSKSIFGSDKKSIHIMQSHGEEVSVLPATAKNVGYSKTCANEVLIYGNEIISTQGHPELIESKMKDIILPRLLAKKHLSEEDLKKSISTLVDGETDILVKFLLGFLCSK